jgi:hypothetical protein
MLVPECVREGWYRCEVSVQPDTGFFPVCEGHHGSAVYKNRCLDAVLGGARSGGAMPVGLETRSLPGPSSSAFQHFIWLIVVSVGSVSLVSIASVGSDGDKEDKIPRDAAEYSVNIMIEKHRSGPVGIVPLHCVAAQTRYSSVLTREG